MRDEKSNNSWRKRLLIVLVFGMLGLPGLLDFLEGIYDKTIPPSGRPAPKRC